MVEFRKIFMTFMIMIALFTNFTEIVSTIVVVTHTRTNKLQNINTGTLGR